MSAYKIKSADGRELTQVRTFNMEPDLFRDASGRAYWSDGAPLESDTLEDADDTAVLREVLNRESLHVGRRTITSAIKAELRARANVAARRDRALTGLEAIEAKAHGAVDCIGCGATCFPAYPTWPVCDGCRGERRVAMNAMREGGGA